MRRAPAAFLLSFAVPALSVLPVVTPPGADPHPVDTTAHSIALGGVDEAALGTEAGERSGAAAQHEAEEMSALLASPALLAAGRPEVLSAEQATKRFALLGVSWQGQPEPADLTVLVRTKNAKGWSDWTALHPGPASDPATAEGRQARGTTEPYFAGDSDGVQVRVDVLRGALPEDLRVDLVDPGTSRADTRVGRTPAASAQAAVARPQILARRDWGADESLRGASSTMSTVKAFAVHHSAGANGYSEAEVPRIIRGLYQHATATGFSDLQYNFVVDRFGRTWEGRAGGVDKAVKSGATGGFNNYTSSVVALGNFDSVSAPASMVDAIGKLAGWKLSLHDVDAQATTTLYSEGSVGTSRYPAGTAVKLPTVFAHRQTGQTACPGGSVFAAMDTIRTRAKAHQAPVVVEPAPALLNPAQSVATAAYPNTAVTLRAGVTTTQDWRLDVVQEGCTGGVTRTLTGRATPADGIKVAWDGKDATGAPARPGSYRLTLSSWAGPKNARPYVTTVDVAAPRPAAAPAATGLVANGSFVPLAAPARILDTRAGETVALGVGGRVDLPVLGTAGVPTTGVTAVVLNVTATCPSADTWLTVRPAGSRALPSGALNVPAGRTRATMVVAPVGGAGKVSLSNASGTTNVAVDVLGYYTTAKASTFHAVAPVRLLDSRTAGRVVAAGEERTLALPKLQGIAASAMTGAVVNVTVVDTDGAGVVSVRPAGAAVTTTSTVHYAKGEVLKNRVITGLTGGALKLRNAGAGTHVVVDLVGFYAPAGLAGATGSGRYTPVAPARVLDTRTASAGALAANSSRSFTVSGTGPVPADAKAVVVTLTATSATQPTYLTAYRAGTTRPSASDVSALPGEVRSNMVVVPVDPATRKARVYNYSGSTNVAADVVGYMR